MKIADIKIGNRVRKDMGDIDALCRSVEDVGLLQPVVVTNGGLLVAGRRRLAAFEKLGRTDIPATVTKNLTSALALLKAERDENVCREDFTPSEYVAAGSLLETLEKPEAKERKGGRPSKNGPTSGKLPEVRRGEVREKVAEAFGVSGRTYEKAKAVVAAAQKEPEKFAPVVAAMDETGNVDAAFRKVKEAAREVTREENRAKVAATPSIDGCVFPTIVLDPPWDWGDEGDKDQLGRARPDYATMTFDQLKELPVAKHAAADCHLYLWITNRSLPKGFTLLDVWGFRYVTCLTWAKPSFGMGNYFRGQTEHILFGVKGSLPLKRKDAGTVFTAPRGPGGHSSKPDAFYELVESCSHGPYLELFSRRNRQGWKSWGSDADA